MSIGAALTRRGCAASSCSPFFSQAAPADGVHVAGSLGSEDLTGRRVTAIGNRPIDEVVELVRPLVPHDNESGFRWLLPEFLATAEVLRGLGIVAGDTATFSFADGSEAALEPVRAGEVASTLGGAPAPLPTTHDPVWLRSLDVDQWLTTLEGGKVVYLGYRLTTGATYDIADRLLALAGKPGVRRVIVDVRLNHGGDNTTYRPLLDVLARPDVQGKLVLLTGRSTFSAAGNFVADLDRATSARLVGEPAGGAASQWGDSIAIMLERTGLTVHVATVYWEFGPPGDKRHETPVDVRVEPTAADFFAGRDPVLARALALP
jgi:Peptidase family S41